MFSSHPRLTPLNFSLRNFHKNFPVIFSRKIFPEDFRSRAVGIVVILTSTDITTKK